MQTLFRAAHHLTYLPSSVSQARQHAKKIHVTRLKILVKIPDSVYGQPVVNLCFKMFYRQTSSFSANVRNS